MIPEPAFFILGAQKSGTTWLWQNLRGHPGTSLPATKEIHYFGGVENYRRGEAWYLEHFRGLDPTKVVGEASTTHLYDRMPYWMNEGNELAYEPSLPPIPELMHARFPDARYMVILRDPVKRAVSAYKDSMSRELRRAGGVSPRLGLRRTALEHPKYRILEYGQYARHLSAWLAVVPRERFRVYVFEEDVIARPEALFRDVCEFLGLDPAVVPAALSEPVHVTESLTRSWLRYYAPDPLTRRLAASRLVNPLDRWDPLARWSIAPSDMAFLRDYFRPLQAPLEELLGRRIASWGARAAA